LFSWRKFQVYDVIIKRGQNPSNRNLMRSKNTAIGILSFCNLSYFGLLFFSLFIMNIAHIDYYVALIYNS